MDEEHTTAAVQHQLDELAGDSPSESVIRALLDRVVCRLHQLCATLLYHEYPRLTRPPLNLEAEELLGAVVERLLKALRQVRPATARQPSCRARMRSSHATRRSASACLAASTPRAVQTKRGT